METPTERKLRYDEEDELTSDKMPLLPKPAIVASPPKPPRTIGSTATSDLKIVQRMELQDLKSRIQQEIEAATQHEKELQVAAKIQTISMDALDSKTGEISESDSAVLEHNKNAKKSGPASQKSGITRIFRLLIPSIREFIPKSRKKGIMERILASGGRPTCISSLTSSSSSSSATFYLPLPQVSNDDEPTTSLTFPIEQSWTFPKTNIQEELNQLEMKEDEQRLQQTGIMTQSQLSLLDITDKPEERSPQHDDDNNHTSLSNLNKYSCLSNLNLPNLYDDKSVKDEDFSQSQLAQQNANKTRALIAIWESKIQLKSDQ